MLVRAKIRKLFLHLLAKTIIFRYISSVQDVIGIEQSKTLFLPEVKYFGIFFAS